MEKKKIINKIDKLKNKNKAVILAHNYQIPDVQDIADFLGDSLDLAKKAIKLDTENIIFCGVDFMAESAKILNPEKNIVHPVLDSGCPMAAMVDTESLMFMKKTHPNAEVVAYINTTAKVKTISDICCTSANGSKVVKSVQSDEVIFIPDQNLGKFIQREVTDKKMILWPGVCPTHHKISEKEIISLKKKHPNALVIVHPECRPEVIDIADYALSTNGMVKYSKNSDVKEFIIGTEKEMCYRLKNENPDKKFYALNSAICPNMKKITLEKVLNSLESLEPKIKLSRDIINKAKIPLQKMIGINRVD